MIANGFKPVGWVAGVGVAALGCYMLSLQVAAERASLAGLDQRIVSARQQIRSLQTELGTRGRIQQLEAWNDEVLALSAPVSGQFVEGQVSLARFDARQVPTMADTANVRMASAAGAAPAPAPAAPAAVPQRAVAVASAVAPPAPVQQATIQRTSLAMPATPPAATPVQNRPAAVPPAPTPASRAAPLAAARAPSSAPAQRMRLADAGPSQAAIRKTSAATSPRPAIAPSRAVPAPTRTAATTPRTGTPPPVRANATTAPPRPSALLNDRAMRDLRAASRAERERGTGN